MPKFRSRPTEIEAYQLTRQMIEAHLWDEAVLPDGLSLRRAHHNRNRRTITDAVYMVTTIHGQSADVVEGDYVITEPDGVHHYPCKSDIFEKKYCPIDQE